MRHIKSREKFLNKNTINESLTNEVRFGGSYLGRLINSTWRLLGSGVNRLKIGSLPSRLKEELELLAAHARLKEDKEDLILFKNIGDEKFFEEVKKTSKELDDTESESEKSSKIKGLLQSCEEKKKSLTDEQGDLKNSIDEFVKGLNEELNKIGVSSEENGSQSQKERVTGSQAPKGEDLLSQNLNSLGRIITKVNNLEDQNSLIKKESKIFEFAPPSEPKEAGVGELDQVKKRIKSAILKLKSGEGGVVIDQTTVKNIVSNLQPKESRKVVINLYRQISEILKTGGTQKSQLMLSENFILSDENKMKMIATKMAEFIKTLMSYKKFYKSLSDIGQDIQTFISTFEKIATQLNKSPKQKVNNPTLYDILGVSANATPDDIKKAYRKKSMDMHPDKGGDEEKFKELNNAYQILSNEDKRKKYNQQNNI